MKHSWSGKNVFVTGATGLVGSILVRTLTDFGANVSTLIFDSPADSELVQSGLINKLNVYNGNLSDYQVVSSALVQSEPDYIFHLGAQTIVGKGLQMFKGRGIFWKQLEILLLNC